MVFRPVIDKTIVVDFLLFFLHWINAVEPLFEYDRYSLSKTIGNSFLLTPNNTFRYKTNCDSNESFVVLTGVRGK